MHYILNRKKQNKRMYLRIKNGEVVVNAPYRISQKEVDEFVGNNLDWIQEQLKIHEKNLLKDGQVLHMIHGDYTIHIQKDLDVIRLKNREMFISNQKDLENFLKYIAKDVFPKYFEHIKNQIKLDDVVLKIGAYTSQWGSCNKSKKEIHLNAYLLLTDSIFLQSVIVHEFAHMFESNHSEFFYDIVNAWMPNYHEVQNKYRNYKFPRIKS